MDGHVFVSYMRDDKQIVDRLVTALRAKGLTVWLDRDSINVGERWKSTIHQAIRSGSLFIACFSRNYLDRDRSYMNEELTVAIDELRQRPRHRAWFIPVSLDGADIPYIEISASETLHDLQGLDLSNGLTKAVEMIVRGAPSSREISDGSSEPARQTGVATPASKSTRLLDKLSEIDQRKTSAAEWDAFIWSNESVPVAHSELDRLYATMETLGAKLREKTRTLKPEVEASGPSCAMRLGRHTIVLSWLPHASNFVARSKLCVLDYDQPYYLSGGGVSTRELPIVAKYEFASSNAQYGWRSGSTFVTSGELAEWCAERLISHLDRDR
ncbi:MAG: toll/interleukin-1 receptor domain-containing protein [Acidobacteriota bacterium]|nr:toll/interleukin-1 receptor domain-containing protein [Acidobacteriota bacterium]